jgi:Tfp pilus assembly protein PilF
LALFHLYYSNENEASHYLRKALRYSPNILESVFFAEFKIKYPGLAKNAKQQAINELQNEINKNNNNILKARLARLVLNENPNKAEEILEDVRKTLPSLNRPWTYLAYLKSLKGNSKIAQEYFSKALFLNPADYLSNFYFARFLEHSGEENKAITYYKRSLNLAQQAKIIPYKKNSGIPDLKVILYSPVLTDLNYYTQPQIEAGKIFQFFADYYFNQNNKKLNEYYQKLAIKYENTFYRGNEKLL